MRGYEYEPGVQQPSFTVGLPQLQVRRRRTLEESSRCSSPTVREGMFGRWRHARHSPSLTVGLLQLQVRGVRTLEENRGIIDAAYWIGASETHTKGGEIPWNNLS